jgi:hypothetical protein
LAQYLAQRSEPLVGAEKRLGGVARSAAVMPSAPEATLRSTVTATQQRAPSGQRISESARLLSSEIV